MNGSSNSCKFLSPLNSSLNSESLALLFLIFSWLLYKISLFLLFVHLVSVIDQYRKKPVAMKSFCLDSSCKFTWDVFAEWYRNFSELSLIERLYSYISRVLCFFFFSVKLKISTFVELFKTVESVSFLLVISVFMLDRANRIPSVCVCMHVFHKLMRE